MHSSLVFSTLFICHLFFLDSIDVGWVCGHLFPFTVFTLAYACHCLVDAKIPEIRKSQ